jgi:hypothetical protein
VPLGQEIDGRFRDAAAGLTPIVVADGAVVATIARIRRIDQFA